MRTYSLKPADVEKKWVLIDGTGLIVGRLASIIAGLLRGKHRVDYTPHVDCGDNVVVVNADKVVFSGNKPSDKIYYRHTGHVGGIKSITADQVLTGKFPCRVLKKAVQRMLSNGPLGRRQMCNLKLYAGAEHPHAAQQPETLDVKLLNRKNSRC